MKKYKHVFDVLKLKQQLAQIEFNELNTMKNKQKPTVIKSFEELGEVIDFVDISEQSYDGRNKTWTEIDECTQWQTGMSGKDYMEQVKTTGISEPKRVSLLAKQKGRY